MFLFEIIIFLLFYYASCLREVATGKSRYLMFSVLFAVSAVSLCVYLTVLSIQKPGCFTPFWFEDVLIIDVISVFVLVVGWSARNTKIRTISFVITTVFMSLFFSFFVCEITLRLFFPERIPEYIATNGFVSDDWMKKRAMLSEKIPSSIALEQLQKDGVSIFEEFYFNDFHIIPEPSNKNNETRIMWLGDSTTEGVKVAYADRFVSMLEKDLEIVHYNFAVSGISTDFEKTILDRYFDVVKPTAVFLGFYPLNDCREFGSSYSECGFSSLYAPEGTGFRYNCDAESLPLFAKIYSLPPNVILRFFSMRTALGAIAMNARNSFYAGIANKFYIKSNPFRVNTDSRQSYIDTSDAVCSMINEMNRIVISKGSMFAVVMIPYPVDNEREKVEIDGSVCYPPDICANKLIDCMNRSNIPFFNAQLQFSDKDLQIHGGASIFLDDHVHMNKKGHSVFEKLVAPFEIMLLKNRGVQKPLTEFETDS